MRRRHAAVLVVAMLAALFAPVRVHPRVHALTHRAAAIVAASNDLAATLTAAGDQSRSESGTVAPRTPLPFAIAASAAVALVLAARRDRFATVHRRIFGSSRFAIARRAPPSSLTA